MWLQEAGSASGAVAATHRRVASSLALGNAAAAFDLLVYARWRHEMRRRDTWASMAGVADSRITNFCEKQLGTVLKLVLFLAQYLYHCNLSESPFGCMQRS